MSSAFVSDEKVFSACRNADKIIIGLSGGADSIALTHILCSEFGSDKIICAHVNHMLRGEEADRDENFVRSFCNHWSLTLHVLRCDVAKLAIEQKMGTEECGRKVRYDFFNSLAEGCNDLIATAHNADDNAETVIMNLARGTGLKGLCGIPPIRNNICRPILNLTRNEIEAYCKAHELDYVIDSSNMVDEYDRNKIRHQVIPALCEINSGFIENISRSSDLLREDNEYFFNEGKKLIAAAKNKWGFNADILKKASLPILRRCIMTILSSACIGGRIEKKHIDAVVDILLNGGSTSLPALQVASVKQNCLTITTASDEDKLKRLELTLGENLLPDGRTICVENVILKNFQKINNLLFNDYADYDRIEHILVADHRAEGDKISLKGRKITKSLKKLFNEMKIPAAKRDDVIVIRDKDKIVFVDGVGVDASYAADENTVHALRFTVIESVIE